MKSFLLNFVHFKTLHIGKAFNSMPLGIIKTWNIEKFIQSLTTNNAADFVKKAELLRAHRYSSFFMDMHIPCKQFHVQCFAHILNLAVQGCMGLIQNKKTKIRKVAECF